MAKFVTSDEFKALNVGFSLDEGIASPTEEFNLYYAERTIWQIEFICHGQSGMSKSYMSFHCLKYCFKKN